MSLGGPWRNVTHIQEGTGPQGGHHWLLTLTCGHITTHPRPRYRPGRRPAFAPRRKRCILCPVSLRPEHDDPYPGRRP